MNQRALPASNALVTQDDARSALAQARARATLAARHLEKDLQGFKKLRAVTEKHPVAMTLAMFGAGYLLAHVLFGRKM